MGNNNVGWLSTQQRKYKRIYSVLITSQDIRLEKETNLKLQDTCTYHMPTQKLLNNEHHLQPS